MPIPWDESASPFFQQTPGFPGGIRLAGTIPGYSSIKPNRPALQTGKVWPTFKQDIYPDSKVVDPKLPYATIGTDLSTGQRGVDYSNPYGTDSAVPDLGLDQLLRYQQAAFPYQLEAQRQAAGLSAQLTEQQLKSLYPYLSASGWEGTQRYLFGRRRVEEMPSNVQNIMASKQGQIAAAQAGEADLMRAVAAQQQAATAQGSLAPYYGQARFA